MSNIFLNAPLTVSQNANVYTNYYVSGINFDYVFLVNVSSLCNNNMTGLFTNATYKQNPNNAELYDVNLVLSDSANYVNWETTFNNQNLVKVDVGASSINFSTMQGTSLEKLGDRFLEVVAHKIFGHGQAHAAVSNDTQFYGHDGQVWDNLSNAVLNNDIRNQVFNQYVASGRYASETNNTDANDVANWVPFNFNNFGFDYPLYLSGNMLTAANLTNSERNVLQNGPNVGGTLMNNGVYNVPILLRFHQ